MNLLDLFSGIGGFSLGLERAGFRTVAFCEIDPFCRSVLAKHWPGVPIYDDVRELDAARLRADGIDRIDAICGGFPCQDISTAGKGAGLDGERSGLWREYARLIGDLRPGHAIVENVGALRGRGLAAVLADLAALGYDAEWHAIPAAAVGAPHLRDRVWIVASAANADGIDLRLEPGRRNGPHGAGALQPGGDGPAGADPDTPSIRCGHRARGAADLSGRESIPHRVGRVAVDGTAAHTTGGRRAQLRGLFGPLARALAAASAPWERTAEPPLCGLDDGLPSRLARPRLKALGNAVVPQIPELIGRAILTETA
jgi:DNA (cytosine-5)-methyltransferase 1